MDDPFCIRCGKLLPSGSLKYIVDLRVYADFDGVLIDEEEVQDNIGRLLEAIEIKGQVELEEEVYLHQVYLICKDCRDRFLSNPLNIPWAQGVG
jgi:hypothetical protein